jgi:two-component system sensor histidine kinase UhpB
MNKRTDEESSALRDLTDFTPLINEIGAAIRDVGDARVIYAAVAQRFAESGCFGAAILLPDEAGSHLTIVATMDAPEAPPTDESEPGRGAGHPAIDLDRSETLVQVVRGGRTVRVTGPEALDNWLPVIGARREGGTCPSYVLAPLRQRSGPPGVLVVTAGEPPEGFESLVTSLADYVSLAVEHAEQCAEIERLDQGLRRTEERARVLSETMSDFVYALRSEPDGTLKREWAAGDIERITGYTLEEMDARGGVLSIVHPDDRSIVLRRAFALVSKRPYMSEYRIVAKDGKVRWIRFYTHPLSDEGAGGETRIYGAAQDITEAKESELALRASEERYRDLVENISEVIYEFDADGVMSYVSPAVEALLGYRPEELEGRHFKEFVAEEDVFRVLRAFRSILVGQTGGGGEYRVVAKSGGERWVRTATQPIYDGDRLVGVRGALVDVTERVQADERLRAYQDRLEQLVDERTAQLRAANERLAQLSRQLLHAQEDERRRVARELHDEIGQALTALRMGLQAVQRAHPLPGRLLEDGIRITEQALQQVRDLSLDLRPSVLDDLGLVPALRWYLDRQARRTGLSMELDADPKGERLPPDLEVACFRLVQEAVTNVARHGEASHVRVDLRRRGDELELAVADDGAGFDVAAALEAAAGGASTGLLGMQERVQLAGGRMEIESAEGRGVVVYACFPLAMARSARQTAVEGSL